MQLAVETSFHVPRQFIQSHSGRLACQAASRGCRFMLSSNDDFDIRFLQKYRAVGRSYSLSYVDDSTRRKSLTWARGMRATYHDIDGDAANLWH
jgi:hypothetical protein